MPWETSRTASSSEPQAQRNARAGLLRQLCESVVVLAVAVLSFREFAAEGYLISTGSMAPFLLGYHRQVACPECHYHFALGVALRDEDSTGGHARAQDLYGDELSLRSVAVCPLCGFGHIAIDDLPRNEGDQLMVHKHAYQFRDPHRWEVIVFRNPADPEQAYVKRVVGLPGDRVSLLDGDVSINGEVQAKPLASQQAMRILVDDHAYEPDLDSAMEWQPRWFTRTESGWEDVNATFVYTPTSDRHRRGDSRDWLTFRHWIATGGRHVTTVPLERWPEGIGLPPAGGDSVSYDPSKRALSCVGVLGEGARERWESASTDAQFRDAIAHLAEASHEAPIIDDYGYNRHNDGSSAFVIRDLMLSFDLEAVDRDGMLIVEINDGRREYSVEFDFTRGEAALFSDEADNSLEVIPLAHDVTNAPMGVEMSLMDQQVLVAINGAPLFPPVHYDGNGRNEPAPRRPLRLAAADGRFRVSNLRVYRDVYYTPKSEDRGPIELASDEFFVLGDNSPVSLDSRCWDDPAVRREDLIGKPLAVHLPSHQGRLTLFGETHYVRIPDFSRVRYIR